jgi:hypothetical protein
VVLIGSFVVVGVEVASWLGAAAGWLGGSFEAVDGATGCSVVEATGAGAAVSATAG